MAKLKTKTTGIPASTRRDPKLQKYMSRTEIAARNNRIALIAFAVLGVVIVLIIGIALLIEGVIVPNQPVATVGNQSITTQAFQRRVIFERWRTGTSLQSQIGQYSPDQVQQLLGTQGSPYAQVYQALEVPTTFGGQILDTMLDELVVQQYAKDNGITADPADVDKQMFQFFGYAPVPTTPTATATVTITPTPLVSDTPTTTPTLTPVPSQTATSTATAFPTGIPTVTPGVTQQFATYEKGRTDYFTQVETISGMSASEVQQIFNETALEDKVKLAVAGAPQTQQEQVKARHILLKTKEDADSAMAALQKGASFANLARAMSTDTGSAVKGGELGWAAQGTYVTEFDAAVWNKDTKVGDVVGPIQTQFGYHIIQLEGRETRTLTSDEAATAQAKKFTDWLAAQQTALKAVKFDYWSDRVPVTPTLAQMGLPDYVPPQGGASGSSPLSGGVLPGQ